MRGGRGQGAGYKLQGDKAQGASCRLQGAGDKVQGTSCKLQVSSWVWHTMCNLRSVIYILIQTFHVFDMGNSFRFSETH